MKRVAALATLLALIPTVGATRPVPLSAWCARPSPPAAASRLVAPCVRKTVSFSDLPAELARIERSCPGVSACPQHRQDVETKDIATPGNHLWMGPTTQSFDEFQQNGFIADARTKAQAARPPAKDLVTIEYLYYYPTCTGGAQQAILGARATYAGCGPFDSPD